MCSMRVAPKCGVDGCSDFDKVCVAGQCDMSSVLADHRQVNRPSKAPSKCREALLWRVFRTGKYSAGPLEVADQQVAVGSGGETAINQARLTADPVNTICVLEHGDRTCSTD